MALSRDFCRRFLVWKTGDAQKINHRHLLDFQKLDPSMTIGDVVSIAIHVAETGKQVGTNTFVKIMRIAGREVTVQSVLNTNNALHSVYVVQ
jgi:hypothetical protein